MSEEVNGNRLIAKNAVAFGKKKVLVIEGGH